MERKTVPFGLLFEEQQKSIETPQIQYDQEQAISFIETESGLVPFVEWEWNVFGGTSTGTSTKNKGEGEDADADVVRTPRTHTVTENKENNDQD